VARARRPTSTSAFGVSRRESHDASDFYARFTPPALSTDEIVNECSVADSLFAGDSRDMAAVPDASVALVVTSPPYFAGKEYEAALGSGAVPADYIDYLAMLRDVFDECRRVLEPGGRICVNVANLGRKPFRSLAADVTRIFQDDLALLLRGEVIWIKSKGSSGNCAWGSYMKASNPGLRDVTERIVVAAKGRLERAVPWQDRKERGLPWESTITKDDFLACSLDTWEFAPASAKRVGHPAPFPVELPRRCIEFYTYKHDVVLDPFMGAGTTAEAALRTGRRYVGFDNDPAYVELAEERIAKVRAELGS
jgi:site-specific DNA-methyltransferase (adenine-specific)